jgi:transposase
MSVYVGIDVHRKRSQVAVVTEDGTVQLNKNVVNGSEPMLRLIGDLPAGTPVAFEAAFGWGWLVELLEDYGFDPHLVHPLRCKAIASARLKNDKGPAPRSWLSCCGRTCCPRHGSRRRRYASSAPCCGTGPAWSASAPSCATGSTRSPPTTAMTGPPATGPARAAAGWPNWTCAPRHGRSSPTAWRSPAGLAPLIERIDGELHQHAKADPRVKVLRTLPGVGEFTALVMLAEIGDITRFGSARKLASWAGLTPTVRGSDLKVRHGNVSKQGSAWLRWVMNQAAQTAKRSPDFAATYSSIAKRRGKKIATIAIARKLLTRAWHLLAEMQATDTPTPPRRP